MTDVMQRSPITFKARVAGFQGWDHAFRVGTKKEPGFLTLQCLMMYDYTSVSSFGLPFAAGRFRWACRIPCNSGVILFNSGNSLFMAYKGSKGLGWFPSKTESIQEIYLFESGKNESSTNTDLIL